MFGLLNMPRKGISELKFKDFLDVKHKLNDESQVRFFFDIFFFKKLGFGVLHGGVMKSRNFRSAHVENVIFIAFKNIENKFTYSKPYG